MDGCIGHPLPEGLRLPEESGQPAQKLRISVSASSLRISCCRLIERHIRKREADLCQVSGAQPAERRGQHRRKRKILPQIIQDLQIIQKDADLIGLKIPFPAHRVCRYPFLREHRGENFRPPTDAAGQDDDVTVLHLPVQPRLFIYDHASRNELPDPLCDHPRLCPALVLFPGILLIQQEKLRPVMKRRACPFRERGEISPRIQRRVIVVLDPAELSAHQPAEHIVHAVQHLPAAAEVLVKIDPLPLTVRQAVGIVFLHKKLRSRQAEPIDALLHISHHEDVIAPAGNLRHTRQDRLLYQVAVLILVDHHFVKPLLIFRRHRRWDKLSFLLHCQDLQGKLLHIIEVDHIPALLLLPEQSGKISDKPCQRLHRPAGCRHICRPLFTGRIKVRLLQLLHKLLRLLPKLLHQLFLLLGNRLVLFRGKAPPFRQPRRSLVHAQEILFLCQPADCL